MNKFQDTFGTRYFNLFDGLIKQVNVSICNDLKKPNAWKAHFRQSEQLVCIKGSFKVGMASPIDRIVSFQILKEGDKIEIPENTWHGHLTLEENSIIVYGIDHKYDPLDEVRMPPGSFGETW